jgi:FlaA1/EpsC-like NDP-sugar epimerase
VLITGGGGSIGLSTTELLLKYRPAAVHVIDIAENALVELVRDLRSRPELLVPNELRLLPIDFGSPAMERFLQSQVPYDLILHFAAHKHVRSEKDIPSLLQMLDTNIVKVHRFLSWLARYNHCAKCFAVSTDKAANPTSFMGASKRLMEDVFFTASHDFVTVTSARFANVAFSNGSLLQGFLFRIAKRQPLAAPRAVRRYFVSAREAAEICLLCALGAPPDCIVFPRLNPVEHLRSLLDIAESIVKHFNLRPEFYEDESAARAAVSRDLARGCYPILVTPFDTSGEKPYEEFVAADETEAEVGFQALKGVKKHCSDRLSDVVSFIEHAVIDPNVEVTKMQIAEQLGTAVPGFQHVDSGRSLDERA